MMWVPLEQLVSSKGNSAKMQRYGIGKRWCLYLTTTSLQLMSGQTEMWTFCVNLHWSKTSNTSMISRIAATLGQIQIIRGCAMWHLLKRVIVALVLFGTDSHTCSAGAFGQFATGIGNTDAGFIMGTGQLLIKVPPMLRFVLDGEMPKHLLAKDLILQIIGEISVAGATYKAMEFVGSAVDKMMMEDRMTLCNMVVEAGAKNGVVPADSTTFKYLEGKTTIPYEPVSSDGAASFLQEYRFDVSKLEPVVAKPHSPDNHGLAQECKDVKIDRVYIGSCTGGKTEDFLAAAQLMAISGQTVKVPTFLVPATQKQKLSLQVDACHCHLPIYPL
ncbi:hypothetical protein CY35_01G009400 [Sphagnum magellanicum]|nr:hypothetical protein CY35_01G009400 [Sphagnum magellanicum]